jgi:hypothetical protein
MREGSSNRTRVEYKDKRNFVVLKKRGGVGGGVVIVDLKFFEVMMKKEKILNFPIEVYP